MNILKVCLLTAAAVSIGACTQVENGNRGVKTHYGKVVGKAMPEGLYWYNPWSTDIIEMNVQQKKWSSKTLTYTRDIQQADIDFVVTFHLQPDKAHVMYQRVGIDWTDQMVPQVVLQAIKNEVGRWTAVEVIENRGRIQTEIQKSVLKRLATRNVVLDGFDITDVSYSDAFEQAVESKTVATQNAQRAQNITVQKQEEAKQVIIAAEAEAKSMAIRANALAQNRNLIEYEAVQKWNGELPMYQMGGSTPFINLNKK